MQGSESILFPQKNVLRWRHPAKNLNADKTKSANHILTYLLSTHVLHVYGRAKGGQSMNQTCRVTLEAAFVHGTLVVAWTMADRAAWIMLWIITLHFYHYSLWLFHWYGYENYYTIKISISWPLWRRRFARCVCRCSPELHDDTTGMLHGTAALERAKLNILIRT